MTDEMRRLCRYRFLVLIRINGLLKNARRLVKAGQVKKARSYFDRARRFIDEANEVIKAYVRQGD